MSGFTTPPLSTQSLFYNGIMYDTLPLDNRYRGITSGTASPNKALILDGSKDITGVSSIGASTLILGGAMLSSTEAGYLTSITAGTPTANKVLTLDSNSRLNGTLNIGGNGLLRIERSTNGAPFISVNGTSSLSMYHFANGDIYFGTTTAHALVFQTNSGGRMIIGSNGAITGISSLSTTSLVLGSNTLGSTEAGYLTGITAGTASASKALVLDASRNITNINSISTTSLTVNGNPITGLADTGILAPSTKTISTYTVDGNVWYCNSSRYYGMRLIDVDTFAMLSCSGGGLYNDQLVYYHSATPKLELNAAYLARNFTTASPWAVSSGAFASQLNLSAGSAGQHFLFGSQTASSSKAQFEIRSGYVANASDSNYCLLRSNVDSDQGLLIRADGRVSINGTAPGSGIISNPSAILHVRGGVNQASLSCLARLDASGVATGLNLTNINVSIYANAYIWSNIGFIASSDKRLKTDIEELPVERVKQLLKLPVVSYKLKNDDKTQFGILAQDLVKLGFTELVSLTMNEDLKEEIDEDGFIYPEGAQLTVSYDRLAPLLLVLLKDLYERIKK